MHATVEHPLKHPVRPPLRVLALYALGQLGWSLGSYGVSNLLIYFYMPPEEGQPLFPTYIHQGAVVGFLTLIGIISASGRLFDAIMDPIIANWSDRKQSKTGKRKWFLLRGAVPFSLAGLLIFCPLASDYGSINILWLLLMHAIYYFFLAFYLIPYSALIPELGHEARDRMVISTLLSIAWALGFILGTQIFRIQAWLTACGHTPVASFQTAIGGLQLIALFFMLLPAIFLREGKYALQQHSAHTLNQSLGIIRANVAFRWFLASDLLYWIALTFVQLGIGYYTTLLLGLDIAEASTFSLISFLCSFLFYWPIHVLAGRWGKNLLMKAGFLVFALLFSLLAISNWLTLPPRLVLYGLGMMAAFPLAVFGILPNALIGDLVEVEEKTSGQRLSGMFFGVRALVMKVGVSISNLLFPSLLLLGKSLENPSGVHLTTVLALCSCLGGWWLFRKFSY
jgi:Na+/melibiose symporter-like transporter